MTELQSLFSDAMQFEWGVPQRLSPRVRRVIARNPSPFTLHGTASFLVGHDEICIIDPGPALPEHLDALVGAIGSARVQAILVTHTHLDHSPAARPLAEKLGGGVPILARDRHPEPGAFGADMEFRPDRRLVDGEIVQGPDWTLQTVECPGHTANHIGFVLHEEQCFFPGDLVMGWASTVILPPDGRMADYRASLRRLLEGERRTDRIYRPAHGPEILNPHRYVRALLWHREQRTGQILASLNRGAQDLAELVERIYPGLDSRLRGGAQQSVLAHLLELEEQGRARRVLRGDEDRECWQAGPRTDGDDGTDPASS